jgi:hypothetical protein
MYYLSCNINFFWASGLDCVTVRFERVKSAECRVDEDVLCRMFFDYVRIKGRGGDGMG